MLSCQQMQVCPHVVLISAQKVQFPLELAWRLCCKLYSNSEAKLAEANITHTLDKLCARFFFFLPHLVLSFWVCRRYRLVCVGVITFLTLYPLVLFRQKVTVAGK